MRMPDHGLFVAGIVHDVAPDATIECIAQEKYAKALGLDTDLGGSGNNAYTLMSAVQSVTGLGAIVVSSAGNDADIRNNASTLRHAALYPAGFANEPYSVDGVIPVGAVHEARSIITPRLTSSSSK
jgi:hypothetical protein